MAPILDRRLIFVTGKGGVGKSTVALALGLLAARRGLRTIVAELAGSDRVQQTLDSPTAAEFAETQVAEGLYSISIDPQHAMEEYLRLKAGALGQVMSSSRLFNAFAMATPGMRELLSIGKVWELAQFERRTRDADPYDVVVVDAPATGHGVGLLRTPSTFAEIARVGPIAHQGSRIASTIADRSFTAIVAVSTAEEMPVTETLALHDALMRDQLDLDAVIVNGRYPRRFDADEAEALERVLAYDPPPRVRAALRAALSQRTRVTVQEEQQARLERAFPGRAVTLPLLFSPELRLPELERLADRLDEVLA